MGESKVEKRHRIAAVEALGVQPEQHHQKWLESGGTHEVGEYEFSVDAEAIAQAIADSAAAERERIVDFIRQRGDMANALMRFGGSGGGLLHGVADEIEPGEHLSDGDGDGNV